jgi:hypothetical protein
VWYHCPFVLGRIYNWRFDFLTCFGSLQFWKTRNLRIAVAGTMWLPTFLWMIVRISQWLIAAGGGSFRLLVVEGLGYTPDTLNKEQDSLQNIYILH